MVDPQQLYAEAARAAEEQWIRELVGPDQPVTPQAQERALGALFDRWVSSSSSQG